MKDKKRGRERIKSVRIIASYTSNALHWRRDYFDLQTGAISTVNAPRFGQQLRVVLKPGHFLRTTIQWIMSQIDDDILLHQRLKDVLL